MNNKGYLNLLIPIAFIVLLLIGVVAAYRYIDTGIGGSVDLGCRGDIHDVQLSGSGMVIDGSGLFSLKVRPEIESISVTKATDLGKSDCVLCLNAKSLGINPTPFEGLLTVTHNGKFKGETEFGGVAFLVGRSHDYNVIIRVPDCNDDGKADPVSGLIITAEIDSTQGRDFKQKIYNYPGGTVGR